MRVLETERLVLDQATSMDAPFILTLLNDPAWLQFIGDRNVHSIEDAEAFIENRLRPSYATFGFGFYVVRAKENGIAVGFCGLVKRDFLPDVDIGYAFLPQFRGQGYAFEAASGVMTHAKTQLNIGTIYAITDLDNHSSIRLLTKLGLHLQGTIIHEDNGQTVNLFGPKVVK